MKRIFVTVSHYTGDLGGVAPHDVRCNVAAAGAALGGTWKAWMSDDATDAIDRINDVGPWFLLDGTKVFNNKTNLTTDPLHPINLTEQLSTVVYDGGSANVTEDGVWTGTRPGGIRGATSTCASWTGSPGGIVGRATLINGWTYGYMGVCADQLRLYCLEQ